LDHRKIGLGGYGSIAADRQGHGTGNGTASCTGDRENQRNGRDVVHLRFLCQMFRKWNSLSGDHLNLGVDQAFWPKAATEFAEVPWLARIKPQILAMRARRRGFSARQTDLSNLIRSVWVQIKVTPITATLAIIGARQGWRVPSGLRPRPRPI
jgi:hypothetical protein